MKVKFDYKPQDAEEMEIKIDDIITVIDRKVIIFAVVAVVCRRAYPYPTLPLPYPTPLYEENEAVTVQIIH